MKKAIIAALTLGLFFHAGYEGASVASRTSTNLDLETVGITKSEDGIPVGTIIAWPNSWVPDGWTICNGRTPSDASTEFRSRIGSVPDLRGIFLRGAGQFRNGEVFNHDGIDPLPYTIDGKTPLTFFRSGGINHAHGIGSIIPPMHYKIGRAGDGESIELSLIGPDVIIRNYGTTNERSIHYGNQTWGDKVITAGVEARNWGLSKYTFNASQKDFEPRPDSDSVNYIMKIR